MLILKLLPRVLEDKKERQKRLKMRKPMMAKRKNKIIRLLLKKRKKRKKNLLLRKLSKSKNREL